MDKNYEEGEEEIISESEESEYEESAFSDDIIGWEDDGDSSDDEQIDFDKSMYEIATLPVEDAPDLTNIDAPWIPVTEPENGDLIRLLVVQNIYMIIAKFPEIFLISCLPHVCGTCLCKTPINMGEI